MSDRHLRILLALVGDIYHEPAADIKYGLLHTALESRFDKIDVVDATLRGPARIFNALRVFHPNPSTWRERFWKNVPAFRTRSRLMANKLLASSKEIDIVLQLGVLFNTGLYQSRIPLVIYTDYTASLSAARPEAGRSPFTPQQRNAWLMLERQSYADAVHIFVRSELVRRSIIHDYGVEAEKVTVVGGGVNFASLPEPVFRPENEAPRILFIGKEFYRKGGDILLQAFAQVRRKFPLATLQMVTDGPIPPGFPMEHLEVLQPTWEREKISSLFQAADIFVLPSRLETWGDVLLEAMSWGLPCIGVRGDAMNEIILDGETGFLIPSEGVTELSDTLLKLLQQPDLRVGMGSAGRQRVASEFTWDHVVRRMEQVFDRIEP